MGLLGFRGDLEVRICRVGIHMRVLAGLQLRLSKLEVVAGTLGSTQGLYISRPFFGVPLGVLNFLEIPKSDIAFVKVR